MSSLKCLLICRPAQSRAHDPIASGAENPVQVPAVVKSAVYTTAHLSGLSWALARRYRGSGIIFALHSIAADDAFHPDHTLRCPQAKLEWILRWLREQRLDFVTLDEAVDRLNEPSATPFVAFTFDDGFADNLTRALPLMEKFAAPFTVYVPTGMITRDIDAWWFGVAELVRCRDQIELPGIGRFRCGDRASKQRTYAAVETAVHKDFTLLSGVREVFDKADIRIRTLVDCEALTEEQLRTLSRHPLVTIGSHTTTHPNLKRASASAVRSEMAENRKFLQELTGTPVAHNAYPFGHAGACGEREAEISRLVGFRTAVTTRPGTIFPEHREHLHALPRVCLTGGETAFTLHGKLNGLTRAMNSRFGHPVALM
jgi:peptidoglycan/xylan/chitin deacetylase (PgdA/CDA1 family)